MAFDKSTNSIVLDENSDFLVDSGVFFIHTLQKTAISSDAPAGQIKDWRVLENWLGCEGRQISSVDEEKIGKGWKAYLAIGLAPSFKLQSAFDYYCAKYKDSGYSFKEDKPPTEVMDVFDRLLATDDEIEVKKRHDWAQEKKKFEAILKKLPRKRRTFKEKLASWSKSTRALVALSVAWFLWVSFRTADDWEILGIYLDDWDEDMFIANVILPIAVVWCSFKAYRWIAGGSK